MADSANILQVMAALGIDPASGQSIPTPPAPAPAPVSNVLQAAVAPPPVVQPPIPTPPPVAAPVEAPRRRRSLLDTIGRLADVVAKVGGAEALYQPTLDAREDRELALGDHARKVDADTIALETSKFDLGDKQNIRIGQAARGLKAIIAANPQIGVDQAWPVLAERMHLDPETTKSFGAIFAQHPEEIDGVIAAMTDPKYDQSKYGGSVVYGKDANGNIVAYQPSLGDDAARSILPEGVSALDPMKPVDTGGAQVLVGTRSGNVQKILPKTARPDTVLTTTTSSNNNKRDNQTKIIIAGMPARAQPGKNGAGADPAFVETAQGNLNELRGIYRDLKKMGAMVSPAQSTDKNVVARIRASGIGQTLEGAVGTKAQTQRDRIASIRPQLMQSLAKATGMTGKQLDSNADVKLFMQTVTNPASSYEANMKAIDGLERFLKANAKSGSTPAPSRAPKIQPRKSSGGWSVVKVQ